MVLLLSSSVINHNIILPVSSFAHKQLPCAREIKVIIGDEGAWNWP